MQVTRWWWIRHAPVTEDGGRVYGQRDLPANTTDRPSFESLAAALPAGAVWLTSHLQRTDQTARAIAAAGADFAEPLVEPDLAEQNFGEWQGEIRSEIFDRHAEPHALWLAPPHVRPPGGESFEDLSTRVAGAIGRLTQAHAGRDIVAVAHGGSIRAALGLALGLDAARAISFNTGNLSLTRLDHLLSPDGEAVWRVMGVNLPPGSSQQISAAPFGPA